MANLSREQQIERERHGGGGGALSQAFHKLLPHVLGGLNSANLHNAQGAARANIENRELDRPNGAYGLISATPATAVLPGQPLLLGPLQIEAGTTIKRIVTEATDSASFVVQSWKWNSTESVRGGAGIPLAAWLAWCNREDSPVPFVLRRLTSQMTVTAIVLNVAGTPQAFKGFGLLTIDSGTACAHHEVTAPERHVAGFLRLAQRTRKLLTTMTGDTDVHPRDIIR